MVQLGISNSRMKDFFDAVRRFVLEPLQSVANGTPFIRTWRAGGPWRVEDDATP
jgi:hypothetical protein